MQGLRNVRTKGEYDCILIKSRFERWCIFIPRTSHYTWRLKPLSSWLFLFTKRVLQMVNIWLYSLSFRWPHLYYRQSYWLNHRKKIKKKVRSKKIAQKLQRMTNKDYLNLYILIIILNLAIYKLYFDVAEEVLIY